MNKKLTAVLGICVFAVVMAVAVVTYNKLGNVDGLKLTENKESAKDVENTEYKDAPDFEAKNQQGQMVKLSSFEGKPTIISFWTTWCPNCRVSMAEFQKVYDEMGEEVNIVMINAVDGSRETEQDGRAYIKEKGYTFPVLYDVNYEASYAYGVTAIPVSYFINAKGQVVTRGSGALDVETIKKGISMIK